MADSGRRGARRLSFPNRQSPFLLFCFFLVFSVWYFRNFNQMPCLAQTLGHKADVRIYDWVIQGRGYLPTDALVLAPAGHSTDGTSLPGCSCLPTMSFPTHGWAYIVTPPVKHARVER